MTETTLSPTRSASGHAPQREVRSWREHSLVQLTLVRYREFIREPEAVFWVFVFPILLAAGLGLAFRDRPAQRERVAVLAGAPAAAHLAQSLGADSSLSVQLLSDSAARRALATGAIALLVVPQRRMA